MLRSRRAAARPKRRDRRGDTVLSPGGICLFVCFAGRMRRVTHVKLGFKSCRAPGCWCKSRAHSTWLARGQGRLLCRALLRQRGAMYACPSPTGGHRCTGALEGGINASRGEGAHRAPLPATPPKQPSPAVSQRVKWLVVRHGRLLPRRHQALWEPGYGASIPRHADSGPRRRPPGLCSSGQRWPTGG